MSKPKIGVPRVYEGEAIPILYPGECARPTSLKQIGDGAFTAGGWIVEAAPGAFAWWLRLRWRLLGNWLTGPPKIEVDVEATEERE